MSTRVLWASLVGALLQGQLFALDVRALAVQRVTPTNPLAVVWMEIPATSLFYAQTGADCRAEVECQVEWEDALGQRLHSAQWQQAWNLNAPNCTPADSLVHRIERTASLPLGVWVAHLTVLDLNSGRRAYRRLQLHLRAAVPGLQVSDPWLNNAQGTPTLARVFSDTTQRLRVALEMASATERMLAVRINLFRQSNRLPGAWATPYISTLQITRGIGLKPGVTPVEVELDVRDLQPGAYLLEAYVLSEDGVLAERSTSLRLSWSGMQQLLNNVDTCLAQLACWSPAGWLDSVAGLDRPLRREALLGFWQQRAQLLGEDPNVLMEQFYMDLLRLGSQYDDGGLGWRSPRCQTALLFGEPNRKDVRTWKGQNIEVWVYSRYARSVVFRQQGKQYREWKPA